MPTETPCDQPGPADTGEAMPVHPPRVRRALRGLAATLVLAACTGNAAAAEVRVTITTGESGRPPVITGNDFDGAVFTDGARHTGSAAFGHGSAAFDIAPQLGLLSLVGRSAITSFAEWGALLRETVATGQVEISDSFRIEGPIVGTVAGVFVARVSAELLPAIAFEQEFLAARSQATVTTTSRTQLLLAQRTPGGVIGENRLHDQVGSWLGAGSPCACAIGTDLEVEFEIPLSITDDSREFSFNLNTFVNGTRGGGFAYGDARAGLGAARDPGLGVAQDPGLGLRAALAARTATTAGDPSSALSFELRLPAGLSLSSGGANYLRLATIDPPPVGVPEPASSWLLLATGAAALATRRWRRGGAAGADRPRLPFRRRSSLRRHAA